MAPCRFPARVYLERVLIPDRLGAWALGTCAGPVVGGAIAQMATWRWVFYIMFPFCGGGLLLIPWLVTLRPPTASVGEKLGRVDWLGSCSFVSSATLFLIAVSWGGIQFRWHSAATLVPLCLGTAGLLWTMAYECLLTEEPFLRLSLFRDASSTATYLCGAIQGLVVRSPCCAVGRVFTLLRFTANSTTSHCTSSR